MTPEIRAFEFGLGLYSVLIGLAVADIATSLHRLLRTESTVRWDPLPLLAALYALLMAVGMWFDLWGIRDVGSTRHFLFYLSLVAELFVLFLVAAASLPDEPRGGLDLRQFYERNARYYWALVAVFQVLYAAMGAYFVAGLLARATAWEAVRVWIQWGTLIVIPVCLAALRRRVVHFCGFAVLFAVNLWHYARYAIL